MAKLTKAQFDAEQDRQKVEESPSAFRKRQTAIAKKVWDWQQKADVYAWDAAEVAQIGITLIPKVLILECDGTEVQFYRDPTPDGQPDMEPTEGVFGNYKLMEIRDGFYRIESVRSPKRKAAKS